MADPREGPTLAGFADRAGLRRALRHALETALPDLRIVAEGFFAEVSPIDLLGVGAEGELIAVRWAAPGTDPETLTRVLADLSWLRPRRMDLLKLAAGLGIDPSTEPRALLVAPEFGRETRAAVDNFPADTVQLWRCLPGHDKEQALRVEPVDPVERPAPLSTSFSTSFGAGTGSSWETNRASAPRGARPLQAPAAPLPIPSSRPRSAPEAGPPPRPPRRLEPPDRRPPLTDPPSPSAFRTGLCEADLAPSPPSADRDRSDPEGIFAGSPGSPGF